MQLLEKTKRPVMAAALALAAVCLFAGAASAMDYCAPCVSEPLCTSCSASLNPALAPTNLPGFYSNDYDYSTTARYPNGIDYLVPTTTGLIEYPVMPLRNPVDRYYATHEETGGQVIDKSAAYQPALSIPHYVNPDGTWGRLAADAETYDGNDFRNVGFQMITQTQR